MGSIEGRPYSSLPQTSMERVKHAFRLFLKVQEALEYWF